MSTPNAARKRLPQQPSEENLRKQAKRRARMEAIQLAEAQHRLAGEYGFPSWPKLMAYVESQRGRSADWYNDPNDNLPKLANAGDLAKVRAMIDSGQFTQHDLDTALGRVVCGMGKYSAADRWVLADLLIDAGADPDGDYGGNYGPIVFGPCEGISYEGIKYLIDRGADVAFAPIDTKYGKACPLSHLLGTYSRGKNEAKHKAIDLLLSKGAVVPPEVIPEVFAIHRGDAKALGEMLDADRSLLGRRFRDLPYGNIALAGATLLHCAVEFGEIECVDAILSRYKGWGDLDMNSKAEVIDGVGGQTPLYHAINTNGDRNFYTLEYVIQRAGQFIDMGVKATWREYGKPQTEPLTPLEYALKAEREMDPKWAHHKPRVKDEIALLVPLDRRATIRKACAAGDVATVIRMLDEHPVLLGPQLWPATIFQGQSLPLTQLLLDRGVDPNLCSAPRKPLHLASERGLTDIVRLLLSRGARLDVVDGENITPYELMNTTPSKAGNTEEIRQVLRDAGAKDSIFSFINRGEEDAALEMLRQDPSLRDTVGPIFFKPIDAAARAGAVRLVRALLDLGAPVDDANPAHNTPLWLACQSSANAEDRIAVAELLLEHGANPRRECEDKSTPLHFAAWRGPIAMVELVIRHNAKTWLTDKDGKLPIDYAKTGPAPDRDAIVHMLDRPVIDDPNFRAAVNAIQAGDLGALKAILADHPNLVTDRAVEPACYPSTDYFGSPKLLWFVANNPTLMKGPIPRNIVEIAGAIIDAGAEMADLQYTLGLVMTSSPAREQGLQRPLIKLLVERGATVDPNELDSVLGHGELDAVAALLESGMPMSVSVAAAMGNTAELTRLLPTASAAHRHAALSVAVINRQPEAARFCLDAGADVNAFLVCHVHSTPAHQAAINDDVEMLKLLVDRGTRLDVRDKLWDSTPLGWAVHEKKNAVEAYLRSVGAT